ASAPAHNGDVIFVSPKLDPCSRKRSELMFHFYDCRAERFSPGWGQLRCLSPSPSQSSVRCPIKRWKGKKREKDDQHGTYMKDYEASVPVSRRMDWTDETTGVTDAVVWGFLPLGQLEANGIRQLRCAFI